MSESTQQSNETSPNPLYLPDFVLQYDSVRNIYSLFHPRSGEIILGCESDGNAASINRRYSFWTRPSETYATIAGMKKNCVEIYEIEKKWKEKQKLNEVLHSGHLSSKSNNEYSTSESEKWLKEEGLAGYYGPRIAKNMATCRIQQFARVIIAKNIVRKRIHEIYEKIFDDTTGYFFFIHRITGQTQWYRPLGLGNSALTDIAEKLPKPNEEPVVKIANQVRQNMIDCKTYPSIDYLQHIHHTQGPYFTRQHNQPSKKVTRSIIHNTHNSSKSIQKDKLSLVNHPTDLLDALGLQQTQIKSLDYSQELLGTKFQSFDGVMLKKMAVDPYMLLRSAYEKGASSILSIINRYIQNEHVIYFGCLMLAKYDFLENKYGLASDEAREVIEFCLHTMKKWKNENHITILAACVYVLVTLADVYANRVALNESNWIEILKECISCIRYEIQQESKYNLDLGCWEIVEVQLPTSHSIDLTVYACRLLANIAYDELSREFVAEKGFSIVAECMTFCESISKVQQAGCLAIFNFVYRSCNNHKRACDENMIKIVELAMERHCCEDYELLAVASRTLSVLAPNGWKLVE